jgi:DNA-binding response OmpR family regulator
MGLRPVARTVLGRQEMNAQQTSRPAPPRPRARATGNIVVADDDPDLRELVGAVLRADGHRVTEVKNGEALLDHLAAALAAPHRVWPPDLVITDIRMPGLSGLDVVAGLRRRSWSLPFIVITAAHDGEALAAASRCGVLCVLPKPFRVTLLSAIVRGALAHG